MRALTPNIARCLMIAFVLSLGLAACGKEGPPEPPEDEKVTYPKTYPTR
jgi:predicted small lipoprotein YifL